jgi:hypothetical protein
MKKHLLFLLLCPFLAAAQSPNTYQNEFAFSPLPTLGMMGIEVKNQPFFIEYKRKKEKKCLRLGVQLSRQVKTYRFNPLFDINDSILVLDTRSISKEYGYFKIGTEYQKNIKSNERVRFRAGLDALIGIRTTSWGGAYTYVNLKKDKIEFDKVLTNLPFGTIKNVLSAGASAILGLDILLGNRTYLGLTVFTNATLNGMNQSELELDMKISPYLAVKF